MRVTLMAGAVAVATLGLGVTSAHASSVSETNAQDKRTAAVSEAVGRVATSMISTSIVGRTTAVLSGPNISGSGNPGVGQEVGSGGQGASDPIGLWANFTGAFVGDDTAQVRSDGNVYVGTVGADYRPARGVVVGAAVSVDRSNIDLSPRADFDGDGDNENGNGEFTSTAVTFSPYAAFQIDNTFSVAATGGLSFGNASSNLRANNFTIDSGDVGIRRQFLSVTGSANTIVDRVTLGGSVGLFGLSQQMDGYTNSAGVAIAEDDTYKGQLQLGSRVGYLVSAGSATIEPFARLGWNYDFAYDNIQTPSGARHPNDRMDLVVGGGVAFYSDGAGTGSAEAQAKLLRENITDISYSVNYRIQF